MVTIHIPRSPHLPIARADAPPLTKSCSCTNDDCLCAIKHCAYCGCVISNQSDFYFCSNECTVNRYCDDIKKQAEAIPKVQAAWNHFLVHSKEREPITFIDFPPPYNYRYGWFDSDNCCWEYSCNPLRYQDWDYVDD